MATSQASCGRRRPGACRSPAPVRPGSRRSVAAHRARYGHERTPAGPHGEPERAAQRTTRSAAGWIRSTVNDARPDGRRRVRGPQDGDPADAEHRQAEQARVQVAGPDPDAPPRCPIRPIAGCDWPGQPEQADHRARGRPSKRQQVGQRQLDHRRSDRASAGALRGERGAPGHRRDGQPAAGRIAVARRGGPGAPRRRRPAALRSPSRPARTGSSRPGLMRAPALGVRAPDLLSATSRCCEDSN